MTTPLRKVCAGGGHLPRAPACGARSRHGSTAISAPLGSRVWPVAVSRPSAALASLVRRLRMGSLVPGSWGAESRGWLLVHHYRSFRVCPNLSLRDPHRAWRVLADGAGAGAGPEAPSARSARLRDRGRAALGRLQFPGGPTVTYRDAKLGTAAVISKAVIAAPAGREKIADMDEQLIGHRAIPVCDPRVPSWRSLGIHSVRHRVGRIPQGIAVQVTRPRLRDPGVRYQCHKMR